ncbi:MAG: S8 family serine peptidase [Gemmatimonadaceae bacterium]
MRSRAITFGLFSLVFSWSAGAQQGGGDPPRRPFLFKDARGELAAARARGDTAVTLVVASMPGANARAAKLIAQLGGTIRYRDDDVDYLRVRIRVDSVDKLVRDPLIHSADVSISRLSRAFGLASAGAPAAWSPFANTLPFATDTIRKTWPPTLPETPLIDRYDPLSDMGAIEWRKANPTFDGRGTTIAIIDQSLDALLPELQVATTLDGKPTRKIIGYQTAVDIDDEDDGQWLRMKDTVVATGGRFRWKDTSYTAPSSGTYRIAQLDEAVFDSLNRAGLEKDLNRDGNPPGSSRLFTVLWNEVTNDVWVDTDQDLDFSDERAYTDYAVRPEFGVIGKDKPDTPIRESVSFAVQIDRPRRLVALNLGVASHASLVVGAVVASRGTQGRFDGVAPGAQLVNMAEGGAAYGQTEAVIRAVKHPSVDVVFLEQSSVISRTYLLFDGRLVPTVIYGRLIAKFGKAIVIPTHNYAVLAAIDDYALAPGAISVGAHESKANFMANHGVRVQHDDNLLITGGYGPMGNGALKPDIIAPSNYVSTGRGFIEGTAIPGLMQLPPGYSIAGGTSTATPTTAGAVALLISAARQSNVKWDPYRIRQALMTSGRWVSHLPANKQGNGVVNIAGAWEALRAMDTVKTPLTIVSKAPVKHSVSHLLATPNEGIGIYERDGWATGTRGDRTITFTRTTGPKGPLVFTLGWIGNTGTFSSPSSVTLPLNTPVPVTVGIAPTTSGVHTAIMMLDFPGRPGVEYRTQATVVAAEALSSANGYKVEQKLDVPRPGMTHLYYQVPAGASTLRLDVDAPKRRVSVSIMRPDTRTVTGIGSGFAAPTGPAKATYAVSDPVPGVWEVRLQDVEDTRTFDWQQAKKPEHVPNTPVTVTLTALGADASVTATGADGAAAANGNGTHDVQFTNRFGTFPGAALSLPMGSIRRERGQIRETEQRMWDIDVPPGSTMLVARVRQAAPLPTDLDLFLFDCTGKECVASKSDGDPTGDESVTVVNPAAGKWKVVVDAPNVGGAATSFDYEDIVLNPAFGFVAVTDQPKERTMGASWAAKANAWLSGSMPAGRMPYAAVMIQAQPKGAEPFSIGLRELVIGTERASGSGTR